MAGLVGLMLVAAGCGGGGSGPTPTPTSDATKAASFAVSTIAMGAAGEGADNGLSHLAPAAMVIKTGEKSTYTGAIDTTRNCDQGGLVAITGTMTADCTGSPEASWSCDSLNAPMQLVFNDCRMTTTFGATTYALTITGTASATMTGSVHGTGQNIEGGTFAGTFSGAPAVGGDLSGSVDLTNMGYTGTLVAQQEPTTTCSGTTSVTLAGTIETCSVSSDCSTCTQ